MPFDMPLDALPADVARRADRGRTNYLSGLAAEAAVERRYERAGYRIAARRWRGTGGEIDLIIDAGDSLILVEVKSARTHHAAWESFRPDQFQRVCATAEQYAHGVVGNTAIGMRLDLVLVDGQGHIEVMENFLY